MSTVCTLCPHHCQLESGQTGLCRARKNRDGTIQCSNYGQLTALALDPIEKKPLRRFYPGSYILSVGSYGCNLRCPFCQNSSISMAGEESGTLFVSPEQLVQKAQEFAHAPRGNIGLAFTYNEPLVGYEYVRDCSQLAHIKGLKTVVVTNGMICKEPFQKLLPLIDAINIDLKGFTPQYYRHLGGDLKTVMQNIVLALQFCHVEVTTLIVPGENDSAKEMSAEASWLASLSPDIPLHISRFFPRYREEDKEPTPVHVIYHLCEIARQFLHDVYPGNC
ncbi:MULTISPECIES: AmmeMemoRadiSam system radical SAM enzyme [Caproicibacterium]|jgi:pyruvate formate lyase activating enzyme|uniref:AmmeMemoRadiSam system radical SAM enzyme n=1 Tax=Caproicibacterium lactatifermentans TaxID=2666138 RepID=A0ABX6PXR2_9FIRM|nr:AmmeMemoRadiSam system radical SAM enzyme [Caproicibacterium lactatifermentans]ARP50418.1 AmmeMemoRadiSam system radical SAM enzyme [Ruminococcaceae bacterium CPB6]QKO31069.1 AmmeMemoRadiSam system radical SAM enzyme [Caproicibacterium lactatifermentans]